jgi:uncharacterized protein
VTGERMDVLDAVRGVAVLGILFVNIESLSGWGFVSPEERASLPLAAWDDEMMFLVGVLVEAKFYALFSLLFGVGYAVFVNRAQMRGAEAGRLFKRRLVGLLLIGLIHTLLIWFGDILVTYAILGFGLLPFLRKDDRTLLGWAAILFLLPAVLYMAAAAVALIIPPGQAPAPGGPLPPVLASAVDAFARGNYIQVVEGNAVFTVANLLRRVGLMFFPRVFAMFLVGFYVGRRGLLTHVSEHRRLATVVCRARGAGPTGDRRFHRRRRCRELDRDPLAHVGVRGGSVSHLRQVPGADACVCGAGAHGAVELPPA